VTGCGPIRRNNGNYNNVKKESGLKLELILNKIGTVMW
jgi:hypothetical protein